MTINDGRTYSDATTAIFEGDCLERLRQLPDASVDAVITDPPYGLANTDPAHVVEALTKWATGERDFIPTGKGFMGKAWDAFVPPPAVWDECLRVLKPGGHLLAFAGSRTFDLMTLSIRMAGFEIRDSIAWLYGSGFPKSLDLSKAIDKLDAGDERLRRSRAFQSWLSQHMTPKRVNELTGTDMGHHLTTHPTQPAVATADLFDMLRPYLPTIPAEVEALVAQRTVESQNFAARKVTGRRSVPVGHAFAGETYGGDSSGQDYDITEAHSPAARQWQGWGTALKPAFEPIVVARKPLIGTVAANVLEHGTGALNIDGGRVGTTDDLSGNANAKRVMDNEVYGKGLAVSSGRSAELAGRFPANVILDESQAAALDEQAPKTGAGGKASGPAKVGRSERGSMSGGFNRTDEEPAFYGDTGGASRFFYTAKAGAKERPKAEDGTAHPTVKPLALMRYLVKLVTPPGGIVLEPFAGSGTTIEAARLEGFRVIGIERDPSCLPLIQQRIDRSTP